MRGPRGGRWDVHLPAAGIDPYLAATLWLLDHDRGALVGAPPPGASVHARTLAEAVPRLDLADPGQSARRAGLALVLIEPGPAALEALDRRDFDASCELMLLASPAGSEQRPWQDAWVWAQRHDPPRLVDRAAPVTRQVFDPAEVLTDEEVWALALRAGACPAAAADLRGEGRAALVSHGGPRHFLEWRR